MSWFVRTSSEIPTFPRTCLILRGWPERSFITAGTAGAANIFSKDVTGTTVVLNARADIEFAATADQTALGFAAGTTTAKYGSGNDVVGKSSDLTVSGVDTREELASSLTAC